MRPAWREDWATICRLDASSGYRISTRARWLSKSFRIATALGAIGPIGAELVAQHSPMRSARPPPVMSASPAMPLAGGSNQPAPGGTQRLGGRLFRGPRSRPGEGRRPPAPGGPETPKPTAAPAPAAVSRAGKSAMASTSWAAESRGVTSLTGHGCALPSPAAVRTRRWRRRSTPPTPAVVLGHQPRGRLARLGQRRHRLPGSVVLGRGTAWGGEVV